MKWLKTLLIIFINIVMWTKMSAQGDTNITSLNAEWRLSEIETLEKVGMGQLGDEFRILDFRHEEILLFKGKEANQPDSASYLIQDNRITLFNDENIPLQLFFKIQDLTSDKLTLICDIETEEKVKELLRLVYMKIK